MRKALLILLLLPIAACNREQPTDAAPRTPPATPAAADPVAPVLATLKRPLPENFELPFTYHTIADNTGKTEEGKPQRRILVEFIGQPDAAAVQALLETALAAKGFSAPTTDQVDGKDRLTFKRADGVTVLVRIDPQPKRLRHKDALGTMHLTWDSA